MRLSLTLCKWPRSRPNGYIWSGKHQMVRKVRDSHLNTMKNQIEMVITITIIRNVSVPLDVSRKRTTRMSV